MRLDHLLSKEFLFWNGKKLTVEDSFKDFWLCLFWQRGTGFLRAWHAVGVLEQRSGPDPTDTDWLLYCGCLFGVGVLVVNCIVDASIFDLCKQY